MTSSAARLLALAAALAPLATAACGSDPNRRSEANYCTQVGNHLADLNAPAIATGADITGVIGSWRAVADSAPIAIEAEWTTMIDNLETASTVDPTDAASMQKVADTAREAEPAANRVIDYTQKKCGALIGSIAPVVTTTTAPTAPSATTATTGG